MTAPAEVERRYNPWLVLIALCLGFFMILLDTTIVNVAIPALATGLNAQLSDLLWILNAYILVYAVLLITAGRIGDLYGPKLLFMSGLVIFTAASAACGFAHSPTQLIVFRVIQGLGGALLTPQTLSVITMIFPPERRGAAFGVWGSVAGVATVAGPVLGGWLVTDYGWRWIFYVNVPIGIIALVMAGIVMPNLKLNRRHRLDVSGVLLSTAALFLIVYGLIEGQSHDWGKVWGPITIVEIVAVGVVMLAAFIYLQWAERHGEPLVPFSIFKDRNFSIMNGVVSAISFGMLGLFLPLTIFLQSVLGLTALQAGLTTAPMSVISMFIAPLAGRYADKIGGKWILSLGVALFAGGMAILLSSSQLGVSRWHLLPGLIVAGFGLGMTFAPLQTIAMRNIEPRMAGAASGLINTTRQLGGVVGSAAVGALLQAQLSSKLGTAATENAGKLPAQYRESFINGFKDAAGSLDVGAGQNAIKLPAGVPASAAHALDAIGKTVFDTGFTNAMRVTLWLPIIVMGVAAVSVTLVRHRRAAGPGASPEPVEDPVPASH
ncbi:DHA2 family efflux MFS transporter permease subunit [Rugosimonospora acidiphila]|uniref:DHA2 family efflux MFS transporter permease subunit n=1 Tax=Rugosimonospora acidiphila TaxID=556531 RepID=A0ABP9RRR2_9ACTN